MATKAELSAANDDLVRRLTNRITASEENINFLNERDAVADTRHATAEERFARLEQAVNRLRLLFGHLSTLTTAQTAALTELSSDVDTLDTRTNSLDEAHEHHARRLRAVEVINQADQETLDAFDDRLNDLDDRIYADRATLNRATDALARIDTLQRQDSADLDGMSNDLCEIQDRVEVLEHLDEPYSRPDIPRPATEDDVDDLYGDAYESDVISSDLTYLGDPETPLPSNVYPLPTPTTFSWGGPTRSPVDTRCSTCPHR